MRILATADVHIPADHPGYLPWQRDIYAQYKCDAVINIGDLLDVGAISRHLKDPENPAINDEMSVVRPKVQQWYKAFPKMTICCGNHEKRLLRQAATVMIPESFLRTWNEILGTPKWIWVTETVVDDVLYIHGEGTGGLYPAPTLMRKRFMSVVSGHVHHASGIWWAANSARRIFGCNLGIGADEKHPAFRYAANNPSKGVLSCAVILDGMPLHLVMPMGRGEKYHRSRFLTKKGR